uniref:Uncharacterized protein n=1 Tax=Wuchereria bancrofti TaxID=6293 RepID=A0AAF5PQC5_WUCBA
MLPKLVEAFSDTYDEDMMLYPVQEKLFGLDSMSSGCKVVTQIRKLTSFLERVLERHLEQLSKSVKK